jgi:hypothetical protein
MTSRLKKIIATGLLGALLALVLAACGGADPTATPTATPKPADGTEPTATPVPSFDAEAYFKGKTIRLTVGFGQGGGTDATARFLAANWGEFIPGNPRLIVSNITPVVTERNFVWNAKPDGLTLGVEATPGIQDEHESAAQFDMAGVRAIGSTSGGDQFWIIRGNLPYGCADTAIGGSETITIGDGIASALDMGTTSFLTALIADYMDLPYRAIHIAGDTGSNAQMLMLERGDVNSWSSSTVWNQIPGRRPGWIADGYLEPFVDMSFHGASLQPNDEAEFDCPHIETYLTPEQYTEFRIFNDVRASYAKNIIGPPGIPDEVINALRRSLDAAMEDAEFAQGMATFSGILNRYTPGEKVEEDLHTMSTNFRKSQGLYDELRNKLYDKFVN